MAFLNHRTPVATLIALLLVFLIAAWMRFQFIRETINDVYIARDAQQYVNYGRNLLRHWTFSVQSDKSPPTPDSFRSPGYPILVALSLKTSGEFNYIKTVLYFQALLSALLVPLTFLVGTFYLSFPSAFLAAGLVALSPHLITTTACVLTETLFSFLLLSAVFAFQLWQKKGSIWLACGAAVIFGIAYLTNETALFLPFIIAFVIMRIKPDNDLIVKTKKIDTAVIVFLAIYSIFPVGWWLRGNCNVPAGAPKGMDRAVVTMSHGAYPGFIYQDLRYKRFPYREDPQQPVFGSSFDNFFKILWPRVQNEPIKYLTWYIVGKPYYLWSWEIIQGAGDIYINPVNSTLFERPGLGRFIKWSVMNLHAPILILALISIPLILMKMRLPESLETSQIRFAVVPITVCLYFTIVYTIFAPWPRYSIPLRPELYLVAVWTLTTIGKYLLAKRLKYGKN
jgi:4-amino-4-deoxy-L-arabinose transferase-like glycosyltransferase